MLGRGQCGNKETIYMTTAIISAKDDVILARKVAVEWEEVVGLWMYFEGTAGNVCLQVGQRCEEVRSQG